MPALAEILRERVDKVTSLPGKIAGFGTLTAISLSLPDFSVKNIPGFIEQFQSLDDFLKFLQPKIMPLILIGVTILWYSLYKNAVVKEIYLVADAFDKEGAPEKFASLDNRWMIPGVGYVIVLAFCALILMAPHLSLYCIGALVLHGADLGGSALSLQNIYRLFSAFGVRDEFARKRRDILEQYYFGRPTLPRIGMIFVTTAVILFVSTTYATTLSSRILYGAMIANILIGEAIIHVWRAKRDRALEQLDVEEDRLRSRSIASR